MPTFEELSEVLPDDFKPPLDRENPPALMTSIQKEWRDNGLVILRDFIDHDVIDAYCDRWIKDKPYHKNWRPNVPYMDVREIRELCLGLDLASILRSLIGEEMGLHLNLCNWVSTERDFHQDDYLNPEYINNHYAAVWFALDEIHPDSGPFEWVEGSHKWPLLRRGKVWNAAPPEMRNSPEWNDHWPSLTQSYVAAACEEKAKQEGAAIREFIPAHKGDVLIWSGALVHRGSAPKVRGMQRRALIAHYSGLPHRKDMPRRMQHENKGVYFVL